MLFLTIRRTGPVAIAVAFLLLIVGSRQVLAYHVDEVHIDGNASFSDGQVKKLMKTKGSSWYKKRPYIKRVLELDLANIEAFYHKNGFLDCTVSSEELYPHDGDAVTVHVHIEEGSRISVAEVLFSGNNRLGDALLRRGLSTNVGQPLDVSLLRRDMRAIADLYGDVGYPYASVAADVQRDSATARVTFSVSEGQPVYIEDVRIRGLREVQTSVVKRELTLNPGDLYHRASVVDSRQRVYSTALFSYVDVRLDAEAGDSLRPDLMVVVQERPMRWVGLRTEVGQDEEYDMTGDLSAEWGNKNLFASGRRLSLKATATFRILTEWENLKNRLELTYTEPWFLSRRMPAWVNLYYEPGLKSKGRSYRVQRFGGEFNISKELGKSSRIWSALRYEKVDIFGLDPEVATVLRKLSGVRIRRYLSLSWERDTRNHVFLPSRGSLSQVSISFVGGPLGGDDHYIKAQASWNRYQRFFPPAVLASRVKVGWAEKYGAGEEVPPDVRFYAGGANTVRGYRERSLGPLDPARNPLGGKGLLLLNVELRRPIWGHLGGSLFFDLGNVWEHPRRAQLEQLNSAVGLELWFATPVGPIRLSHGIGITDELRPAKGRWHLAILFAY